MEEYDLLQCIDRALDEFGSSTKNTIFWRMTVLHNSNRSEVISDPRIFVGVIEELLGNSAPAIKKAIIREIRKKFDLSMSEVPTLEAAIEVAREQVAGASSGNFQIEAAERVIGAKLGSR